MKKILLFALSFYSAFLSAQAYPSSNINLLGMINPNSGTVGAGPDGRLYAGCWGWKQTSTNKEYAIVGSSIGTYFIDVTNPSTPSVCAFVGGKQGCTWRELKTYQNYCYVVSDDSSPNTFQIIDMSQLPSTVTVVHDGTTYFERGHTIYIDGDKMYVGSVTYTAGGPPHSPMNIYSLATPTAPTLLRRLDQDYNFINYAHDMFVLHDTVYASCGTQGLYVFLWQNSTMSFTQIGSYTGYAGSNYNHSSWITSNRQHLVFCDEVPTAQPIRIVNVSNLQNIQPEATMIPHPNTTPHNPYVLGNNYAVVACYQDGINLYNISNPTNPFLAGFFDTHPQEGANTGNYNGADYRGNWGAYPYLPSGIIIATDMQNGVFFLDPAQSFAQIAGVKEQSASASNFMFFPNPASDKIAVHYNTNNPSVMQIKNMLGQVVYEKRFDADIHEYVPVKELSNGTYLLTLTENGNTITKKLTVTH